ncbi:4-hydroxy-tetrahydrodipicolinate reductase [bacterium]|nr:4-hydroxy-tetrahydrodipicolinate reductase [bacterium]
MIKLAIAGAAGRMGTTILKAAKNSGEFTISSCFEHPESKFIGLDAGEIAGVGNINVPIEKSIIPSDYDVIIDFTNPISSVNISGFAAKNKKPLVIGTTGFDDSQLIKIKTNATVIPCVLSPNMSVGVNLLFYLVKEAAKILDTDYNCEIIESHHNKKKDAPSGTAKKIAEVISETYGKTKDNPYIYGRQGMYPERAKGEIGIHSIRAGDIVGEHNIIFAGDDEVIEISHRAGSRNIFAFGALKAAKFVYNAKPGLYSMADVLNLPK